MNGADPCAGAKAPPTGDGEAEASAESAMREGDAGFGSGHAEKAGDPDHITATNPTERRGVVAAPSRADIAGPQARPIASAAAPASRHLPGDLMMWVLIISELAVFAAGLLAFLAVRLGDPAGFAEAQDHLNRVSAGINTVVLVTSGLFAALALRASRRGGGVRLWLLAASGFGVVFLVLKGMEYAHSAAQGIGPDSGAFFMFYFLLTGFHAVHVVAGIVVLWLCAITRREGHIEAGTQFWHMVDLVWVILFPVIYLLR